jgi:hypothetical protein
MKKMENYDGTGKDSEELNKKIIDFKIYLKNALTSLEKLGKVSEVMGSSRSKFHDKYKNLLGTTLPSY